MMAKAGTPQVAASLPNQWGGVRPVGPSPTTDRTQSAAPIPAPSSWFMSPASESKTHRHSTATPTPARTLGRYHAARKNGMPRTFRCISTAAASASPCPSGTATST